MEVSKIDNFLFNFLSFFLSFFFLSFFRYFSLSVFLSSFLSFLPFFLSLFLSLFLFSCLPSYLLSFFFLSPSFSFFQDVQIISLHNQFRFHISVWGRYPLNNAKLLQYCKIQTFKYIIMTIEVFCLGKSWTTSQKVRHGFRLTSTKTTEIDGDILPKY